MHVRIRVIGVALLILFAAPLAHADSDTSDNSQSAPTEQAPSRLLVSGSSRQFSIEADHADVQSAIKAIFTQAGKQFDLGSGVAGQFTLKLDNQSLDTVLTSLCGQTFLKFHQDGLTGIYHFDQDTEAEKAAFSHLDTLNGLLRQQLRELGLDLPAGSQLNVALGKANAAASNQAQNRALNNPPGNSLFGGSGGGASLGAIGGRSQSGANTQLQKGGADQAPTAGSTGGQAGSQSSVAAKSAPGSAAAVRGSGAVPPTGQFKDGVLDTGSVPDYLVEQLLQAYGVTSNSQQGVTIDRAFEDYLKQNNLVAMNTHGVAAPVTDVLAELSRQSGVKILLDPNVPRGARFRITLSLPACTLTEALNLILPPARLKWRTINDNVYVTPTPDFQIFYGSAPVPYVIYGSNSTSRNLQPGASQNGVQGGSQAPSQNGNPK